MKTRARRWGVRASWWGLIVMSLLALPPQSVSGQRGFGPVRLDPLRGEVPVDWKGEVEYPGERTGGAIGDLIRALRVYYWTPGFRHWTAPIHPASDLERECIEVEGRSCLLETEGMLCRMDGGRGEPCREGLGVGRKDLLRSFETALSATSGNPWVVGQYVYFLNKIDDAPRARAAVTYWCDSPEWWCHALLGYLEYSVGRTPAADEAFERMLVAMSDQLRCQWEGLGPILDAPLRQRYESMDCAEQSEANRRIWWLGDPLWTVDGNDRRSAHFYRLLVDQLVAQLDRTGGAYMSLLDHWWNLRFGYVNGWVDIMDRPPPGLGKPPSHRALRAHWYQFVPGPRLFEDPFSAPEEAWGFAPSRAWAAMADQAADELAMLADLSLFAESVSVRDSIFMNPKTLSLIFLEPEAYTPRYGPVVTLRAQRARFLRGDSMRLVLVSEVTDSTMLGQWNRRALLATSTSEFDPVSIWLPRGADLRRSRFEYDLLLPEEPILVSAEVFTERSGAARLRYAQHPLPGRGDRYRISDILLWEPVGGFSDPSRDDSGADLEFAIGRALPAERIPLGGSVEMYWELYGLEAGTQLSVSLRVFDDDPGLLRRLGSVIGLADAAPHITTTFADVVGENEVGLTPRVLRLNVARLATGNYRVELEVRLDSVDGDIGVGAPVETLLASRRFEVAIGRVGGATPPGG